MKEERRKRKEEEKMKEKGERKEFSTFRFLVFRTGDIEGFFIEFGIERKTKSVIWSVPCRIFGKLERCIGVAHFEQLV
jgi:hypothetical protein